MEENQAPQSSQTPNGGYATVQVVQVQLPEMIRQGSILPTFVAPPPPPKESK